MLRTINDYEVNALRYFHIIHHSQKSAELPESKVRLDTHWDCLVLPISTFLCSCIADAVTLSSVIHHISFSFAVTPVITQPSALQFGNSPDKSVVKSGTKR